MKLFRLISIIEGLSLLTLLFVAMPLRTWMGLDEAVTLVGWIHGILFLIYCAAALVVSHLQNWSVLYGLFVCSLGAVPFGFLYVDRRIRRAGNAAPAPEQA